MKIMAVLELMEKKVLRREVSTGGVFAGAELSE